MKILRKFRYGIVIILIVVVNLANSNLSLAQNVKSIKTVVNKTDFMGDVLNIYTIHGKFYLNSLGRHGVENKNYCKHEKIINDSEKRGKQIFIKYRYDKGYGREIVDVIPVK